MLFKTSILLTLLTILSVGSVLASPTPSETNAQRMARGLGPKPPAYLIRGTTASWGAKRSTPSGNPSTCPAGRIEVRYEYDGHVAGYLRNWENGGINGINFVGNPLEVKVCEAGSGLWDIIATNPAFPAPYYVGAASLTPVALVTDERRSLGFGNVEKTSPSAPPTLINGNYYESAIWVYNPTTKELLPQYINPDGNKAPTVIAYNVRSNGIFFTGNIAHWNESGIFASAVRFYLA